MENIKLGVVASGSAAQSCKVIFEEEAELKQELSEEDFVIIEDKRTNSKKIGIIRGGRGIDPTLKTGVYSVGTAYVSKGKGDLLSSNRRFFDANINILGEIKDGCVEPNRKWITPASWVFASDKNPFSYFKPEGTTIELGHYRTRKEWKFKLDADMITRHLAVYGATGSGKSHLVREELIPEITKKTNFSVLIFDYSGQDFAEKYKNVLSIKDIALSWEDLNRRVCDEARNFGSPYRDNNITNAVEICVKRICGNKPQDPFEELREAVRVELERSSYRPADAERNFTKFNLYYEDIGKEKINGWFKRTLNAEKIEEILNQQKVLVIDLSEEVPEARVSVVVSILRYYLSRLRKEKGENKLEELNRVIIIDEAPQFCPFTKERELTEAVKVIGGLAALGRKHKLGLVLLAQGMAGDVGINAGIRRNLNTKFIGKIASNDINEALNELKGTINPEMLTNLQKGEFYVCGMMSPVDQAVLIKTFASQEEKDGN